MIIINNYITYTSTKTLWLHTLTVLCTFDSVLWTFVLNSDIMNSISEDCQELKTQYDACFNGWFKDKFLKGFTDDACGQIFNSYQHCVKVNFQFHWVMLYSIKFFQNLFYLIKKRVPIDNQNKLEPVSFVNIDIVK